MIDHNPDYTPDPYSRPVQLQWAANVLSHIDDPFWSPDRVQNWIADSLNEMLVASKQVLDRKDEQIRHERDLKRKAVMEQGSRCPNCSPPPDGFKRCAACMDEKPEDHFWNRFSKCIECVRKHRAMKKRRQRSKSK